MSPAQAARTAAHGRRLLTARLITPHDFAVLDTLLWRLRRPGRSDLAAPYAAIARLAGVCRDTAIAAVRRLIDLGLIAKTKRRVRVRWGRGLALLASRQIANRYEFREPPTESTGSATDQGIGNIPSFVRFQKQEKAHEQAGPSSGSDIWARQNAVRQLVALGAPVPPAWS